MDGKKNILIVDDEIDFAKNLETLLSTRGFDCKAVFSSEQAIETTARKKFQLVIVDLNMPEMDGIQLIRKIKAVNPKQRILIITGFPSHDSQAEAFELGVQNYLVKPFSTNEFLETASKLLDSTEDDKSMVLSGPVVLNYENLIQMYAREGKSMILEIRHKGDIGRIYFEKGKVCHAETKKFQGEQAFFEIQNWNAGLFETKSLDFSFPKTINKSLESLLLKTVKSADSEKIIEQKTKKTPTQRRNQMANLDEILAEFRSEVAEFVSTDIVEIASGLSIGGGSIYPDFDATVASAAYADVVKANERAIFALGGKDALGSTEDILITTEKAYILIVVYPGNKFYHGLAITRKGNLGMARVIMKKYVPRILEVIPK